MTEKQREEAEWESINMLLMRHGLAPLSLVKGTDLKDLIVFDKQSSQRMRQNLKTLVEETARQQNMIQELIETNQQLKNELQLEQSRAADHEQRANDLEQIMESVKSKIDELEDESLNRVCQQQNIIEDLQKECRALQAKCQHYKKKRMEQQETIASLQKDIYRLTKEEEERIVTQNRVFAYLCKRVPHTILDRQLLCLIDYYECKIRKLHKQRQYKENESLSEEEKDYRSLDASPTYKGLLMSLQNQLKESKSKIDALLSEKLNLQKDLETRPTQHELRLYKQQVKKLEKALKKNIKLQDLISQKKAEEPEKPDEPSKDNPQQALIDQRYFQVLNSINSIVHNPRAPVIIYKQSKGGTQHFNKDLVQDCGFEHLIPIIEMWADQLTSLKDLYKSLKILSAELVPWHNFKKQDENEGIRIEDLLFIVDTMLEEVENKEKDSNVPNLKTLQAIVSHFQKLFDVPSLNGVYPRMNEVYTRLGEMNNAVRNLQELLELDSSSSLCVLVNTVGKLCKLINENVNEQVMQVLGPEDLQSIINKLEEHEEFFPAFQAFTNDLLEILALNMEPLQKCNTGTGLSVPGKGELLFGVKPQNFSIFLREQLAFTHELNCNFKQDTMVASTLKIRITSPTSQKWDLKKMIIRKCLLNYNCKVLYKYSFCLYLASS
ncbi:centrosomal protein of 70 kDa isoform X1 [Mustela putorius furo]|uniref:Centrosomal protein of 70 kDa n=1 Tax=Mustela putorius furo TaxID=9669 RepID=A0A8U0SZT9_MUSPF|nr:centrosomal protein of 70 kDa isoform X1 [Mustela putorius furo]XP_004762477.1 centrosomal protein of 70 kDa isoform X1 [Mustela putorius furo]XP_044944795.1 centrosomal protein of 70 kDa isoform X1 [Mustela putorius furo]XP_044944796.1 centrosomal protein of 70 kDa isoform X1 [Mustela putorius furo]XP_044944797.1 centrosomal protein of 70 kDa isoform X1 [Mustela putorius furo]XP_044944798.1 centrosomal protein of 70 kDa isoform X1 [Mustela putorius furo]